MEVESIAQQNLVQPLLNPWAIETHGQEAANTVITDDLQRVQGKLVMDAALRMVTSREAHQLLVSTVGWMTEGNEATAVERSSLWTDPVQPVHWRI